MSTHFIQHLAVEEQGEGEAVVCLHGLSGSSNNWTPVMAAWPHHRVIRVDLPGSARSAGVAGELSIDVMVDAVLVVCQHLGIARAHFVGHSLGTIVCQHLAVREPARVLSLALFGPLLCPSDDKRADFRRRAQKARAEGVAGMQEIADVVVAAATSEETRRTQPVVAAMVRESVMRQDPEGYARSCEALAQAQAAAIDTLRCPVLLVAGEEDAVAPPQAVRAMAERIADSRLRIYPRCGHWMLFERPAECQRDLLDFYAGRGS